MSTIYLYDVFMCNVGVTTQGSGGAVFVGTILTDCQAGDSPPQITDDPDGLTVPVGASPQFSVAASGFALKYQWYFNNVSLTGATGPSYTRGNVNHVHAGNYHVVVANDAGQVKSATAVLTVDGRLQVIRPPANQTVPVTGASETEVPKSAMALNGSGELSGWGYANAKNGLTTDPGWHSTTAASVEFLRVNLGSSRTVRRVAYEPRQMSGSPTGPNWNGVYKDYEIYVTDNSGSTPANWGTPVATGQWTWPSLQERRDLTISPKAGRYVYFRRVTAYGQALPYGYANANEIWVYEWTGGSGPPVTFSVVAIGTPTIRYQWRKNGVEIPGATGFEYTIATTHGEDAGAYDVVVSNDDGATTSAAAVLTVVPGPTRVYTSTADFVGNGILINLNTSVANELRLNDTPKPLPYLNVPSGDYGVSEGRDMLLRLDANTGAHLGEFRTAPENLEHPDVSPSRTAVDRYGNLWVANRNDTIRIGSDDLGSICRIGVVIGGVRGARSGTPPSYTFTPDPNGEYLKPPFLYNTCPDRDGDGFIRTSRGLANILPWDSTQGDNTLGGVSSAQDEAILNYTRVAATGARTLGIDLNGDLWVGGYDSKVHQKVSGLDGLPIGGTLYPQNPEDRIYGGYGGFIDAYGILWSSAGDIGPQGLLRLDPALMTGAPFCGQGGGYGLGINPRNQDIWYATRLGYGADRVDCYLNGGSWQGATYHGATEAQGIVLDHNNGVWVAHVLEDGTRTDGPALGTTVGHIRSDASGHNGTWVGNVQLAVRARSNLDTQPLPPGPTGLGVDANGKLWVCNWTHGNVMRIDPAAGPVGVGGTRIGAVDLTVDLGDGSSHPAPYDQQPAHPYSFSDMTGSVYLGATSPSGVWDFVYDSGAMGRAWTQAAVTWTQSTPAYTRVKVEARAADTTAGLPGAGLQDLLAARNDFKTVNGQFGTVTGRYLEVRVTLGRNWGVTATPVLSDLTIHP